MTKVQEEWRTPRRWLARGEGREQAESGAVLPAPTAVLPPARHYRRHYRQNHPSGAMCGTGTGSGTGTTADAVLPLLPAVLPSARKQQRLRPAPAVLPLVPAVLPLLREPAGNIPLYPFPPTPLWSTQ